ncbi:hypothetical protein [Paludisphaera sp.]|uniref:hypothetical protein n=1 Tax=Paludisphaera sp. TaxID=2017432 RepID=UPI00301B7A8E
MSKSMSVNGSASWLDAFKGFLCRVFWRSDRPCPLVEDDRPITTQEAADVASEDSFPASDPPSYTGSIT